jgi:hypothetical protein
MDTREVKVAAGTEWKHFKVQPVAGFCKHFLMNISFLKVRKILDPANTPKRASLDIMYYTMKTLGNNLFCFICCRCNYAR